MQIWTLAACALLLPSGAAAQSTTADAPPAWQTGIRTEDGTCGKGTPQGWVCTPTWGACCSKDGLCGRSSAFCGDGWYVPNTPSDFPILPKRTPASKPN
jgi:hypothetical protein